MRSVGQIRLRLSPVDGWLQAHGAQFAEAAGWQVVAGFGAPEAEVAVARERVALADMSAIGKVQLEGEGAAEVVWAALGEPIPPDPPSLIGKGDIVGQSWGPAADAGWRFEAGAAYCIRPDLFLVLTPPGGEGEVMARLEGASGANSSRQQRVLGMTETGGVGGVVTVTDLTHGLAALALIGPRSRDVLVRLCALDVSQEAMPNETVRATSVAKTRQVVARRDVGEVLAFSLVGARSLAGYLWEAVAEAGKEFGIAPIGTAAIEALERGGR